MQDYYEILEINKNASASAIKKAYRKLALKYHPDKYDGDSKYFIKISEAYQVLSNPIQKEKYDKDIKVTIDFKDALELFNQVFASLDPVIGDYLKATFTQFKDNILNENTTSTDILKTFTSEDFIDRTTNTLNKYIKKRTLSNITDFYLHEINSDSLNKEEEYIIDINLDFLRKYSFIKMIVNGNKIKKTFMLDLVYTDFTIEFNEISYDIVIYNNFPENLYRKDESSDLELRLNVHIDNYLKGFNLFEKITDNYTINLDIKLETTNIVKLKNKGLLNYKSKNYGDLYIIIIPNKISELRCNIKNIENIKKSYNL